MARSRGNCPKRNKAAKSAKKRWAAYRQFANIQRAKAKSASSESHPVDSIAFVDVKSEIEVKEEDLTDYLCSNSSQNTVVKENENINKIKNVADSFQEKTAETEKIVVYEILDSFLHSEKSKQEEDNKDECLEADFFVSSNKNWCSKTYHRSNASTNPTHIGALSTQEYHRAKEKSTNESHPVDNIAIVGIKSEFELKEEVTDDVTERQEFVSTPEPSSSSSGIFVENNEDTLKNLFDFLYNVVKKFPPNLQSQVKIDLFKVVTEAEMKLQCNDAV